MTDMWERQYFFKIAGEVNETYSIGRLHSMWDAGKINGKHLLLPPMEKKPFCNGFP